MERVVATDGSALGNPGPTGWAWYVDEDNWASGGMAHGTNNIGELNAILTALQDIPADIDLVILADSRYAIDCVTRFAVNWERNGWVTSAGKPVANMDIIKNIRKELAGRTVRFEWTRGHAGHALNEAVDTCARTAAEAARDGSVGPHGPGFGAITR